MPLSWNEIKDRALRYSREFAGESPEDAEVFVACPLFLPARAAANGAVMPSMAEDVATERYTARSKATSSRR